MADETKRRIIYLQIDASKAVDGSTAATRALANVEKGAVSAGSALGALEAASVAAGGAAQRTALDLATSATAATNLNAAYRTTAGGVLELARATTVAATSAQAQAAGFARLAEQQTVQASLAQTRALMDGVARSTANLTQMYGAATVATTTFASAQTQAAGYAKLAEQNMVAASAARTRATMAAVDALTPDQIKAMYFGGASTPPVMPGRPSTGYMGTPGQAGLNAQQKVMLGYQLQDVGVSLIGGMNPLVVAAQQGPQISMLYGGMRNMLNAIPKPALVAGGAAVGGLAIGAVLKEISDVNEALEMQQRRLGALFGPGEQAAAVYREIGAMAAGTAISIADATEAVVAFGRATRDLGGSGEAAVDLATMAEKLAQLSGASREEGGAARGALVAMFKESAVSADQLRTVLTNVPEIAEKIAAGLGVSVGQLRLMTQQGDVTGRQVFGALLSQTDAVNKEFEAMPKSLGFVLKSIGIEIANMVTGLAAAVGQLTVIQSKADAIKAAQAANPARPTPATPRVIGNNGSALSLEEMVTFGEAGQYDVGNAGQLQSQILGSQRSLTAAADGAVLAASKLAAGLNPAVAEVKLFQQGVTETELALGKLQDGLTSFDASKAAQETQTLTANLQALREKADAAGSAYYQALSATQLRQQQDELGMSPGQRAYAANVANLAKPGSGVSIDQAQTVADAQQLQTLNEIVKAKQMEADASTRALEAVRKGKAATIESKVETAVLAFVWANVGKNVEVTADQIKAYGEAVRTILKNDDAMGGVNASKPLLDDLAAIAAAMDAVKNGAFAMKRAEAEAKAARSEDGTGKLQMQVFDARQRLTEVTNLQTLKEETEQTQKLAAAAGNVAAQRKLELDFAIRKATLSASPAARGDIEEAMRSDDAAKHARNLADGAAALERQVTLTKQQIDLVRSGSPDYAVRLAMLQKENDLRAQGVDIESDANAKRQIAAAGEQARLNTQLERAREAADSEKRIWQNAYDNIQSYAGDVFYDIFSGAGVNAQTAAEGMKKIFLRTFAELAAAAIIKPIIQPVFQAGQALGIVPAGVGGTNGFGGTPSAANSNGVPMPGGASMGWFGDTFSGIGNWLKSPITPTTYNAGYGAAADYASLSGTPMPGGLTSGGQLGGLTWGQGLAGIGQIGMGAFQALSSKSTAGTIGGIGSMVGGVVSMLPIPGAQVIGPLISLASQFLPSLFGDSGDQRSHSSTNASLRYGAGGYGTSGGAWGTGANVSQSQAALGSVGGNIGAVYDLFGGVKDASKVWGMDLSSWTASGQNWSYTSNATHLVDPSGNRTAWRMNESGMVDTASAQVAMRSILGGAVGTITENMRTAVTAMLPATTTLQDVAKGVSFVTDTYEKLGKTVISIEPDFEALQKTFKDMASTATSLGLSLEPVTAEQKKKTERLAQDYIDDLIDPIALALRQFADEKATILANVDYLREHTDVAVDAARINEALLRKEANLKNELYGGAVSQLEDAIKRLSYGNLSNATNAGTLAGMRGALDATIAQARSGDDAAIGRVADEITAYGDASRSSYASGPQYEAIRQELLALAREFQLQVAGPMSTPRTDASGAASNNAEFNRMLAQFMNENADLKQQMATLTATMERLVAKR